MNLLNNNIQSYPFYIGSDVEASVLDTGTL